MVAIVRKEEKECGTSTGHFRFDQLHINVDGRKTLQVATIALKALANTPSFARILTTNINNIG
jgi:hypothetical protein